MFFWSGGMLLANALAGGELFLPGTQPREHDFNFDFFTIENCQKCHSGTTNGAADPFFSWRGGMMAQAARDPVFRAALAVANQDVSGVGSFCIRCHSPRAWLAGRSSAADASLVDKDKEDLNGVSCMACHRLVDPLSAEAGKLATNLPPGYGNAMYIADPEDAARGPYPDPGGTAPHHKRIQSPYHASSELCANCHNVSNPTLATDVTTQPPHAFGHIERTYSEWALSDFASGTNRQTCQSCHYPRVKGGGQASRYTSLHRDYFVRHGPTGGSTWVQDAIYMIWKGKDVDREALTAAQARAREFLQTAAALGLSFGAGKARVTITNLTGHKLPTGYPEGRRMWVNLRFLGRGKELLGEVGRYGEKEDKLDLHEVNVGSLRPTTMKVRTLLDPDHTKVYECKPGLSQQQAAKYGKSPGPSFHFILNDVITKDNRIPPRGYRKSAFQQHLAAAVREPTQQQHEGAWTPFAEKLRATDYADGQYWDELEFALPAGTRSVEVRLMYQSVSWEYLKFLVEENHSDSWGNKLYEAYAATGECPPETIGFVSKSLKP